MDAGEPVVLLGDSGTGKSHVLIGPGYVQIDPRGAERLFRIITEREERASIAIATNPPSSGRGSVVPGPRLVAAIVDRVTFDAHLLETGTPSYRLRTSKTQSRRKRASQQRHERDSHSAPIAATKLSSDGHTHTAAASCVVAFIG